MMATTNRRYSKEEFARRGDAIYENEVRPQLNADEQDKFAAIDIETGAFAIDADELKACHKLRKRLPDAQIWMVRVGSPYVHRIGGRERQ
jgi:23S rRNA maturation mini-RNase III